MKNSRIFIIAMIIVGTIFPTLVAHAGTLSFTTDTESIVKNCPTQVQIIINTEGEEVNSAGVNVIIEDDFTINKFDSTNGIFRSYSPVKYLEAYRGEFKGKEYLRLVGTTSSPNGYNGEGEFGTLTLTPKDVNEISLSFYMIPGSDGEDSELAVLTNNGNTVKDVLTSAEMIKLKVVEGECNVEKLPALTIDKTETSVIAEDVEIIIDGYININESNIFDENQRTTWLEKNWIYIAITIVTILLIILVVKKKKKKKEKK